MALVEAEEMRWDPGKRGNLAAFCHQEKGGDSQKESADKVQEGH